MPETSSEITPRCLKCDSDAMVPGVRLIDRGESNARYPAKVGLVTNPDAILFKGEVRVETEALVCGDCGFVEVYATEPYKIWDAHIDRLSRDLD
ncbi:hypothetical protein [Rubrivirga sp.]|uniref:hypothetical protein n=1 Tax=Rubrivirga sp. TaxID=1885344 RepID=UPI003C79057E